MSRVRQGLVIALVAVGLLVGMAAVAGTAAATTEAPTCSEVGYDEDGSGNYEVTNVSQLQCIGEDHDDADGLEDALDSDYILTEDIDASDTEEWNDGAGFDPIGSDGDEFTGTFNGSEFTISNLAIDRSSEDQVGLFGMTDGDALIENIGLENVDIDGSRWVGGLVGRNFDGDISESYATGSVNGSDPVGGLVGDNRGDISESYATGEVDGSEDVGGLVGDNRGDISKSYATGEVDGSEDVGGLVGDNRGDISKSYATGEVDGSEDVGGLVGQNRDGKISESYATGIINGSEYVGGLVGQNRDGKISESYATGTVDGSNEVGGLVGANTGDVTDSYWDVQTTNQTESDGGTGLRTAHMVGSNAPDNMDGFDFAATWDVVDDNGDVSYPFLVDNTQEPEPGLQSEDSAYYAAGDGSDSDPYELEDWFHLDNVRDNLDDNFVLVSDLDTDTAGYNNVASETANDNNGFDPIGDESSKFTGTFNGNQFVIQNLVIDREDEQFVGLFGYSESSSVRLENIRLVDAEVHGEEHVGALAGRYRDGVIENSSVQADVTAEKQRVGGMVGQPVDAELTNQLVARGTVTGGSASGSNRGVGGLVGRTSGTSSISVAYTQSTVSADNNAGGIMGSSSGNPSTFEQMYSASTVEGSNAGAVVGVIEDDEDDFEDSVYYDTELAGDDGWFGEQDETPRTADTVALTTAQMQGTVTAENMDKLDFDGTWATTGGYPIFQWETGIGETTLELLAGQVTAPGESEVEVGVTALDRGVTVAGEEIVVADTGGVEGITEGESVTTDGNGLATFDITAPDRGTFEITFALESDETVNTTATVNSIYDGGQGTADNPYEIASWDALDDIRANKDSHFELVDDLDEETTGYNDVASETANGGDGFEPIGNELAFTGSFDGDGHAISDLSIYKSDGKNASLFTTLSDGTIKNVGLVDADIRAGDGIDGTDGPDGTSSSADGEDGTGGGTAAGLVINNEDGVVTGVYVTGSSVRAGDGGDGGDGGDMEDPVGGPQTGGHGGDGGDAGDAALLIVENDGSVDTSYAHNSTVTSGDGGSGGDGGDGVFLSTGDEGGDGGDGGDSGSVAGLVAVHTNGIIEESYAGTTVTQVGDAGTGGTQGFDDSGSPGSDGQTGVVGGVVAEAEDTIERTYWDTQANTEVDDGIGDGSGDVTGLSTREMIGESAEGNMTGLDFSSTWETVTEDTSDADGDGYPLVSALGTEPQISTPEPPYAGGSGTATDPYRITDWNHLNNVRDNLDANFTLVADLDEETTGYNDVASETANGGDGFEPIGECDLGESFECAGDQFTGSFDGQGNEIGGLYIDREPGDVDGVGLFGNTDDSLIENVGLVDVDIDGDARTGGLVGDNGGVINESYATGEVDGDARTGGLVGNNDDGEIMESYATGNVNGSSDVGGLVGISFGGDINESYATGEVTGDGFVGGLVGVNFDEISESYATGAVDGSDNVGGLVGGNGGEINESYATGDVDGSSEVGGLVGLNAGDISESYATGTVDGSDNVGGIVGENGGEINESYATGDVDGASEVGGLVGENSGEINESYVTGEVDGSGDNVGGIVGLNVGKISDSYVTGDVTGDENVGGLIGQNGGDATRVDGSDGTVRDSYWDTETTDQSEAIGKEGGDDGGNEGGESIVEGDVGGLDTSEMTGLNATDSMTAFEFPDGDGTWHVVEDDYPALAWEDTGPFYGVEIDNTNEPIGEGETLEVDTTVTNWAADGGDQTIELLDFADEEADTESVDDLDSGDSSEITLEWNTEASDAGTDDVTVESENDTDTGEVTIEGAGPDSIDAEVTVDDAIADGEDEVEFTITVEDGDDNAIEGVTVEVADAEDVDDLGGIVAGDTNETDADGEATFTATSTDTGEFTVEFFEQAEDNSGTATATFEVEEETTGSGGGTSGTTTTPDEGTEVTVDDPAAATPEADGAETDADRPTPDTSVSVSNPEPGQTLVIENGDARIVDDPDHVDEEAAEQPDDVDATAPDVDDDDAPATNVRADRLTVEIDTNRDFELSVTTYEDDLTPSATIRGGDPSASIPAAPVQASGVTLFGTTTPTSQDSDVQPPDDVQAASESFEGDTGTVSAGYVEVNHTLDPEEIAGATFEFSIRQSYLEKLGVKPEGVDLYHQTDDEEWVVRETDYVDSDDTYHRFEGTVPGFSVFALGTDAATIGVTDARLAQDTIEVDEEAAITATVENRGQAATEETVELLLEGDVVDAESVDLKSEQSQNVTLTFSPDDVGEYSLTVESTDLERLTVEAADEEPAATDEETGYLPLLLLVLGAIVLLVLILWGRREEEDNAGDPLTKE